MEPEAFVWYVTDVALFDAATPPSVIEVRFPTDSSPGTTLPIAQDVDDLLAGDDLGFQLLLVHFLTERAATRNYARRIGTAFTQREFERGHRRGIEAEARILQDFFGDDSIRLAPGGDSPSVVIRRVFRNDRGDRIRRRIRLGRGDERGVHASSIDVVTRDGVVLTAEAYRAVLEREREAAAVAAQVERERLQGAAEHRAGGRGVPAP
jgi:hypothetical protein